MQIKRAMRADDAPEDLTTLRYPVLVSPKIDGIGCIVLDGVAYSRKMKPIPNKFIQRTLAALPSGMHGELTIKATGFDSWNEAQSAVMSRDGNPKFCFHVFDNALALGTFEQRFSRVQDWMINNATDFYRYVPHRVIKNAKALETYYKQVRLEGFEGAMIRDPKGPYKQGRATTREGYMLKLKPRPDAEAVVVGFEEELKNTNEAFKAEDGRTKRRKLKENMKPKGTLGSIIAECDGETFKVSGFTDDVADEIWRHRKKYMGKVFTFAYQSRTKNNKFRHPSFKGWRHD